jgi:glycosyltransferase involved in cell wall biosynthesis
MVNIIFSFGFTQMPYIAIIIPAYNEENRIEKTIKAYLEFFNRCSDLKYTLIISLNGCTDKTEQIVLDILQDFSYGECFDDSDDSMLDLVRGYLNAVEIIDAIDVIKCLEAGKGLAIQHGFSHALLQNKYDYIGFVDADMATTPIHFYTLFKAMKDNDGVIASRYMKGAVITPARPFIKRWGSKIIYENLIWLLFGMRYKDYQCGAKIFKTHVIKKIVNSLQVKQWAFDVELLYACKKNKFSIIEHPTVWHDQAGSKLKISHGIFMLGQLIKLRLQHSWLYSILQKKI